MSWRRTALWLGLKARPVGLVWPQSTTTKTRSGKHEISSVSILQESLEAPETTWGQPPPAVRGAQLRSQAALPITGWVQCMQRRASIGISLKHSGPFLVVGSAVGA